MKPLKRVGPVIMTLIIIGLLATPLMLTSNKATATASPPPPIPCNNDSYKKSISVSKSTISIDKAIDAIVKNQTRLRFTLADNSGLVICAVDFTSDRAGVPTTEFNSSETFGGDAGPFYSFNMNIAVGANISGFSDGESFKAVAVISADPNSPKDAGRFQGIFLTPSDDSLSGSGGRRFWLWSAVKSSVTANNSTVIRLNRLDELTGRRVANFETPQETTSPVTISGNLDIDFSGSEVEIAGVADKVGPLRGKRDLLPPLRDDPALSVCLFYQDPTFKGSFSLTDCIKVPTSTGQATDGKFSLSKKFTTGNYIAAAAINVETSGMVQLIGDYGTWSFSLAHPIDLKGYGKDLNNVNASLIEDNQFTIYMGITGSGRNALFFGQDSFEIKKDTTTVTLNPVLKLTNETPDDGSINPSKFPCGLKVIVDLFTQGIGGAIQKMIGCLIKDVIGGSTKYTDKYMCAAGQISINSAILPAYAQDGGRKVEIAPTPKDKVDIPKCDPVTPGTTTSSDLGGGGQGALGSFEWELKNPGGIISRVWHISMAVVNVVVILALLAIAFANILHLNINTYAAKKALPGLIIGVIGANASLLFARFLADVTQALSTWAADIGTHGGTISSLVGWDFPLAIGRALIDPILLVVAGGFLFWPIWLIGIFLVLYYLFMIIAFMFSLFKRLIILYFLVMVAPLAFISYGVPGLQQYFFKWWDSFLRFLFLFPIILFGMALTVMLADTIGTNNLMDIFTVPGMVGIALVLSAGSMVLKLPKTLTKVLDPAGGFKKLLGAAPGIMGAGQWAHGKINSAGANRLDKLAAKETKWGNKAKADALTARAKTARDRGEKWQKKWGAGRGYATIFGRPQETAQAWWKERQEAGKSKDMLESSKLTLGGHNIADTVMGPDAAFKKQRTRIMGPDELGAVRTPGQWRAWVDNQPLKLKDHLQKVIDHAESLDPEDRQVFLANVGNAKTNDDMLKYLGEVKGLDLNSLASVTKAGLVGAISSSNTISGRPEGGIDSTIRDDRWRRMVGLSPIGTPPTATQPASNNVDGASSSSPAVRASMAADEAEFIRSDMPDQLKTQIHNIRDQFNDAHAALKVAADPAEIKEIEERLANIHEHALNALGQTLTDEGTQFVNNLRAVQGPTSYDASRKVVENISAALEEGIDASNALQDDMRQKLQQRVARQAGISAEVENVNRDAVSQFDAATLADIMAQNGDRQIDAIAAKLGPLTDRITTAAGKQSDPNLNKELAKAIAGGFNRLEQSLGGRGSKSLIGRMQTSLNNFGDVVAKTIGEKPMTPSSLIAAISEANKRSAHSEPVSNTTTVNSSTVVEAPVPPGSVAPQQNPVNPATDSQKPTDQTPGSTPGV